MPDSRRLEDLHPRVRALCLAHQIACTGADIPFTVTFTMRDIVTQAKLYAQGRTAPGRIVTNARPGQSFHNFGLAYDGTPTRLLLLPNWGDTPARQAETNRIWALYGKLAVQVGLTWGGNFRSIRDRPHCEWSGGLTLAQLRGGARPAAA